MSLFCRRQVWIRLQRKFSASRFNWVSPWLFLIKFLNCHLFSSNFKLVKSLNSVRILLAMLISLRVWKISILLTFYLKSIWTTIKDFKCIKASATKVHPKEICPQPFIYVQSLPSHSKKFWRKVTMVAKFEAQIYSILFLKKLFPGWAFLSIFQRHPDIFLLHICEHLQIIFVNNLIKFEAQIDSNFSQGGHSCISSRDTQTSF